MDKYSPVIAINHPGSFKKQCLSLRRILLLCAVLLILWNNDSQAQVPLPVIPDGPEFKIGTGNPTGDQWSPSIAMDASGNFVVTWMSTPTNGDIYAQIYNAMGEAQGDAFLVNTFVTGSQRSSNVAMDPDGNFVIAWDCQEQSGIYAQRYNDNGIPQGSNFKVNTTTASDQGEPDVIMGSGGDFMVGWYASGTSAKVQRYNAAGDPVGAEINLSSFTNIFPHLARDAYGNFVAVIHRYTGFVNGVNEYNVYAHRFNNSGNPQGSEFLVNTHTTGVQQYPSIGMSASGNFVIAWQSGGGTATQDGDGYGIYAQRFSSDGSLIGGEFQVNTSTVGNQFRPSVAMDASGNFIVVWSGPDEDGTGIFAQRYKADGTKVGGEFQVNTTTAGTQSNPAVAAFNVDSSFVITWMSDDGNGKSLYAQRYKAFNSPPVISSQSFTIQEYSDIGTVVDTVFASEPDEGQSLTYAITSGNTGNVFSINSSTGEITVAGTLVYNTQSTYTLTVKVTDDVASSPQSATATVTIHVSKLPSVFIHGPGTVSQNTYQSYSIVPNNSIYSYRWSYSGSNVSIPDTLSRSIIVGFNEEGNGTLQCIVNKITPAMVIDTLYMDIEIQKGNGYTLPNTLCPEIQPVDPCAGSYIKSIELSDLRHDSSGCASSGYSDHTQLNLNNKLFLGDIYSARLELGYHGTGTPVYYIGLWIDYNNNGSFDDGGEFVSSFYGSDSVIVLPYIPISNNLDHEGPRRLRVQVRTSGPFEAEGGCIAFGETGETEDYLVVLTPHDRLEGAHLVTPNNDGKNDYFVIRGIDSKVSNRLTVFDRLGKNLFSKEGYANDWNGTDSSGELLPPGTYYYVFVNGDDTLKGFFQLNY